MKKVVTMIVLFSCAAWGQTNTPSVVSLDEPKQIAADIREAVTEAAKSMNMSLDCPSDGQGPTCSVAFGLDAGAHMTGHRNTFIGACAGVSALDGSDDILLGAFTALPTPHTSNFVNIGNKLCFWRDTGERADCPPPEKCLSEKEP